MRFINTKLHYILRSFASKLFHENSWRSRVFTEKEKKQLISKFVRTELAEIFFHTVGILLN